MSFGVDKNDPPKSVSFYIMLFNFEFRLQLHKPTAP
jgi:hypothetical protein